MNKQSFNLFSRLILAIFLMFTFSCSQMTIRSSPIMYQSNPVKKIAVFGSGTVEWLKSSGRYLGLTESKQALEILMIQTENVLKAKGYQIAICVPAGIGYFWSNWHVYETPDPNYNKLKLWESKKWEAVTQPPAPLFSLHPNTYDPKVAKAIDEIFTEMETAELNSAEKIAIIQNYFQVDAFLFLRVGGNLYSAERNCDACARACIKNVGWCMLNFLIQISSLLLSGGRGSGPEIGQFSRPDVHRDYIMPDCLFIDAKNNDVLWQHGEKFNEEPKTLAPNTMEKALEHFPMAGQQMDERFRPKQSN